MVVSVVVVVFVVAVSVVVFTGRTHAAISSATAKGVHLKWRQHIADFQLH